MSNGEGSNDSALARSRAGRGAMAVLRCERRLAAVLALALALAGCNRGRKELHNAVASGEGNAASMANAAAAMADVRSLPDGAQLAAAAEAALGRAGAVTRAGDQGPALVTPERLVWLGKRAVLIATRQLNDAPHALTGSLDLYYLAIAGGGFSVLGRFPAVIAGDDFGAPPTSWSVADQFGRDPVLRARSGGSSQGYSCEWLTLTELTPAGPHRLAKVPLSYDDSGAGNPRTTRIEGRLGTIVPNKSFEIRYSGTRNFTETWRREGNQYVPAGPSEMPTC